MKNRILFALVLMGFTALIIQSLLIREFLITFYGNELTIGLILACWILSEALGSWAGSRINKKIKFPFLFYALLQSLTALYLPIAIFLIREVKNIMLLSPGEGAGILPIFLSSLAIIGPLGIFGGMQFPFGCRIYETYGTKKGPAAGRVYVLEAAGFIIAGIAFTYIFVTSLNSFQTGLLIGLINLASGLYLIHEEPSSSSAKWAMAGAMGALLAITLVLLLPGITWKLQDSSLQGQWKNQGLIAYKNSPYGNLAVTQKHEQLTFYSDGVPIINVPAPDIVWTEEFVHLGLLSHPEPKKALFLGGGAGGYIKEALKHPLKQLDYAELDPELIALLKEFPAQVTQAELNDSRVKLHITDGIRFVKNTEEKYDAVFINLPSPTTLQLNRYYTKEFFETVKAVLARDGKLVLGLPGSLSYINEELKGLNLCILRTLREVFPVVYVIPGYSNIYIASVSPFKVSEALITKRLTKRGIQTKSLDTFHVKDRLSGQWQDWFYRNIKKQTPVKENTNLTPAAVFYSIAYWNSVFGPSLRGFFSGLDKLHCRYSFLIIIFAMILLFLFRSPSRTMGLGIITSLATTGFAGMTLNLLFIFSYQAFFGYVYHHIAILVTAFMTGLAFGGWAAAKNLNRIRNGQALFIGMETAIILSCIGCGFLLVYLNSLKQFNAYPVFYILSAFIGTLVGAEFPLANKLYCYARNTDAENAGILYGMDLFGGFFAALLVSIVLVPIFGVFQTCLIAAALKSAGLVLYTKRS